MRKRGLGPLAAAGVVVLALGALSAPFALELRRPAVDLDQFLSGRTTAAIGDAIAERHPLRAAALSVVTATRLLLFGEGSGPVVVGRDGWLFSEEELARHPDDAATLARRLDWIATHAALVRAAGSEVIVVLLPTKARLLSDRMRRADRALADHPRLERALASLASRGIAVVDGRGPLSEIDRAFLRRDTHWTGRGAAAVARAVAERAAAIGVIEAPASGVDVSWREVPATGDLLAFVPLGRLAPAFGLTEEYASVAVVPPAAATGGLFEIPEIPVTLVGTSYSADERWEFAGLLRTFTGLDVLNVATVGEGPYAPLVEYLAGDAWRDRTPRLVVWEIPERYLTLPGYEPPALLD